MLKPDYARCAVGDPKANLAQSAVARLDFAPRSPRCFDVGIGIGEPTYVLSQGYLPLQWRPLCRSLVRRQIEGEWCGKVGECRVGGVPAPNFEGRRVARPRKVPRRRFVVRIAERERDRAPDPDLRVRPSRPTVSLDPCASGARLAPHRIASQTRGRSHSQRRTVRAPTRPTSSTSSPATSRPSSSPAAATTSSPRPGPRPPPPRRPQPPRRRPPARVD